MKNKLTWGFTILVLSTVLFTSCSKVPQKEIDAVNAAIEDAKVAGAEIYKTDKFIELQDSMKLVMINIENQSSKFIKNYTEEKKQLEVVLNLAQELKQETEIRKEEIKFEIQTMMKEVSELVAINNQLIKEAPKGKEGTSALMAIKSELSVIENMVSDAQIRFENGDYLISLDMVQTSKEKAQSINTELNEVITKYKAVQKGKKS